MSGELGGYERRDHDPDSEAVKRAEFSRRYAEFWSNPENVAQWYRENAQYQLPEAPLTAEEKTRGAQRAAHEADDAERPRDQADPLDPRNDLEARERYDPETTSRMLEERDQMKREDARLERKVFGLLADSDGEPLWEKVQHSGERAETGKLWSDLGLPAKSTTSTHLEAHVAAYMRHNGLDRAFLYIDRPVCPYDRLPLDQAKDPEVYPRGCDRLLPRLLPSNSELVVYSRTPGDESNGWAERLWCKTYTGELTEEPE